LHISKTCSQNIGHCLYEITTSKTESSDRILPVPKMILEELKKSASLNYAYDLDMSVEDKIFAVANKVYGAVKVEYDEKAKESLKIIEKL